MGLQPTNLASLLYELAVYIYIRLYVTWHGFAAGTGLEKVDGFVGAVITDSQRRDDRALGRVSPLNSHHACSLFPVPDCQVIIS